MTQGIDSEGDEYEDDQEILDDSENSDDSDPELASPRLIRQANLGMSHGFVSQCVLVIMIIMSCTNICAAGFKHSLLSVNVDVCIWLRMCTSLKLNISETRESRES